MEKRTIVCVGALTMDTIFSLDRLPQGPGKFMPLDAVEIAAGMAASAAASIARLGGAAALWASVGGDASGERLVAELSAEGVDCSGVRRIAGARSAFATILVDASGERIIVPHYDPALLSDPGAVPKALFDEAAAVLVDVRWPEAAARALAEAGRRGIPGILDADVAPEAVLERLAALASHIVASEPAAEMLTGRADPDEACRALKRRFPAFAAVTAGARGSYWFDPVRQQVRHAPAPAVRVVDTLAAGDVFHGAFALGLVEGMGMEAVFGFANAAAALKCTRFGGRAGAPTRAEVEAFLSG